MPWAGLCDPHPDGGGAEWGRAEGRGTSTSEAQGQERVGILTLSRLAGRR